MPIELQHILAFEEDFARSRFNKPADRPSPSSTCRSRIPRPNRVSFVAQCQKKRRRRRVRWRSLAKKVRRGALKCFFNPRTSSSGRSDELPIDKTRNSVAGPDFAKLRCPLEMRGFCQPAARGKSAARVQRPTQERHAARDLFKSCTLIWPVASRDGIGSATSPVYKGGAAPRTILGLALLRSRLRHTLRAHAAPLPRRRPCHV